MAQKIKTSLKNEQVAAIVELLNELTSDQNTSHLIKSGALKVMQVISGTGSPFQQRKNVALQVLEEMIQESNIDVCTRTTLLHTMTLVESLSEE